MAFGLFKRKVYADTVVRGGNITTYDIDRPSAKALAARDGRVMQIGTEEEISPLIGPDTEIIDISGADAVPGGISLFEDPAREALRGCFLELSEQMDKDSIISAVSGYFEENPEDSCCFAIGMDQNLFTSDTQEKTLTALTEFKRQLSESFPDRYTVLVCSNGITMVLNDAAEQAAASAAEEAGLTAPTPGMILSTLVDLDITKAIRNMAETEYRLASCGITTVYGSEKYNFLTDLYQDLLMQVIQEDKLRQRFFGSYRLSLPLPENTVLYLMNRKHTACTELDGMVNFNTLEIFFSLDELSACYIPQDHVLSLADSAADRGYSVRFIPQDRNSARFALDAAGNLSARYKKLSFTVEHEYDLTQEELSEIFTADAIELRRQTALSTEEKARVLAASDLGVLSPGSRADIAVFRDNTAVMTIIGGKTVYEIDKDSAAHWAGDL